MIETLPYEIHEFANLIPAPSAEQQRELENDIAENGVQEPVVLLDKKILDGRSRSLACVRLKLEIPTENYSQRKHGDPLAFVISKNIKRRHLSPSQLAAFTAETLPAFRKALEERPPLGGNGKGSADEPLTPKSKGSKAIKAAAKATGASPRSVERAERVKKASPAKHEEVKAGKKTLVRAERELAAKGKKQAEYDGAIQRMEKVGGDHTANLITAIGRKTRLTRASDVLKFAALRDKDEMERVAYLVITSPKWSLQKCIDWENRKKLSMASTFLEMTFMAVANGWQLKGEAEGWTVEVYRSKK